MKPRITALLCAAAMMGAPLPIAPVLHKPDREGSPSRPLTPADVEHIEAAKAKRARRAAKRKGTR